MSTRAHTILNVDDTAASRYLKSRALKQAGYRVIEAETGQDALKLTLEELPDLVLLDIKLPDISGLDVCRELKTNPRTSRIPIVHISATYVDEAAKTRSIDAGADVYLAEPVGPNELTSAVRTVMRLRAAERNMAESHERMRLATEGAGIATWDVGSGAGGDVWSAQFYAMLGYDMSRTVASADAWLARVPEEERETVRNALRDARHAKGSIALEHSIERADTGERRYIAVFGTTHATEERSGRLIGVAMDVTERKRTEEQRELLLRQANAAQRAAEEAARMQEEFLAILSHELRTPLNAILGWLQVARLADLSDAKRAEALAIVERNARHQTQLISDLLDVSAIITGKLERGAEEARIDTIVQSACDAARLVAAARGIDLATRMDAEALVVRGSASRIEQVVGNLLSNAIKFSPDRGRIVVDVRRDGANVRISVRDEGEGLSADMLPRIFDIFRQVDSSTRRRHGGLGLGLAIVKSLVELHGGTVSASSPGIGQGSTFTVMLPLEATQQVAPPQVVGASPEDLHGVRVLLVDDHADQLIATAQLLQMLGADVMTASKADEALLAARRWRPDVLLLDIAMPDVDGYELLSRVRAELGADVTRVPAIALTGFAGTADVARAKGAGFDGHLAKPFELDALRALIASVVPQAVR
jgi:PAS domain S-box-containing protein